MRVVNHGDAHRVIIKGKITTACEHYSLTGGRHNGEQSNPLVDASSYASAIHGVEFPPAASVLPDRPTDRETALPLTHTAQLVPGAREKWLRNRRQARKGLERATVCSFSFFLLHCTVSVLTLTWTVADRIVDSYERRGGENPLKGESENRIMHA